MAGGCRGDDASFGCPEFVYGPLSDWAGGFSPEPRVAGATAAAGAAGAELFIALSVSTKPSVIATTSIAPCSIGGAGAGSSKYRHPAPTKNDTSRAMTYFMVQFTQSKRKLAHRNPNGSEGVRRLVFFVCDLSQCLERRGSRGSRGTRRKAFFTAKGAKESKGAAESGEQGETGRSCGGRSKP